MFALIWAMAGTSGLTNEARSTAALAAAVLMTGGVVLLALRIDRSPSDGRPRDLPDDWNQRYSLVGIVQGVAIGVSIALLSILGWTVAIPAVVCLIVGIHFFPLAGNFDQRQYWWTGLILCVIAVLGLAALAAFNRDVTVAIVGFGAALTLWVTGAHVARYG